MEIHTNIEAEVKLHEKSVEVSYFKSDSASLVVAMKSIIESGRTAHDAFVNILEIGSQVVSLSAHSIGSEKLEASLDHAQKGISSAMRSFEENLKQKMDTLYGDDGTMARAIAAHVTTFGSTLEKLTAGENSPVRESIKNQFESMSKKLIQDFMLFSNSQRDQMASLLDVASPTSPLRIVNDKLELMMRGLEGVNLALAESRGRKQESVKGTSKGKDYETEAIEALKEVAFSHRDEPIATGSSPTSGNAKKGDGVVRLREGLIVKALLVAEAKDVSSKKTDSARLIYWRKQAEGARKTRGAVGFIGLCKNIEDMPGGHRVYALDQLGRNLVIAFDPARDSNEVLDLVYTVVKMHCLTVLSTGLEINPAAINRYVAESIALLDKFGEVDSSVKLIKEHAGKITEVASDLRSDLMANLRAMKLEIAAKPDSTIFQEEPLEIETVEEETA